MAESPYYVFPKACIFDKAWMALYAFGSPAHTSDGADIGNFSHPHCRVHDGGGWISVKFLANEGED